MIDLHMHTNASDGTDTPEGLLKRVREAGIRCFAVTDHDSIDSCGRIEKLLKDPETAGTGSPDEPGVHFIRGIELSCEDEQGKYHILGYGFRALHKNVWKLTVRTHAMRMKKLESRLRNLREAYGITFAEKDIKKLRSYSNPGKPHISNLMVLYGYVKDRREAFDRYLNRFSPPEGHIRPEEAIDAILADGGIPVLAHAIYGDGDQLIMGPELEERVRRLKDFGLAGLECYYSGFVPKQRRIMLELAETYDLLVTAGSDYHGSNKMIELGDTGLNEEAEPCPRLEKFLETVRKKTSGQSRPASSRSKKALRSTPPA